MTNKVQPGHIRFVKLKEEGKLQAGDQVETHRLGVCTVCYIQTPDSIVVKTADQKRFNLSGFGFKGRVVQAAQA
jgi:hypothetical protein